MSRSKRPCLRLYPGFYCDCIVNLKAGCGWHGHTIVEVGTVGISKFERCIGAGLWNGIDAVVKDIIIGIHIPPFQGQMESAVGARQKPWSRRVKAP